MGLVKLSVDYCDFTLVVTEAFGKWIEALVGVRDTNWLWLNLVYIDALDRNMSGNLLPCVSLFWGEQKWQMVKRQLVMRLKVDRSKQVLCFVLFVVLNMLRWCLIL